MTDQPVSGAEGEDPSIEEWGLPDWRDEEIPPAPWPAPTSAYWVVIGVLAVGLLLTGAVAMDLVRPLLFRLGVLTVGAALLLAALLRLVLPSDYAGMLVVRRRAIDVAVYAVLASATLVLALIVPGAA